MINPINDLYDVVNNTDTVDAEDHNSLVRNMQYANSNALDFFNFQNGRDGRFLLGTISATTSTAPTVALVASGELIGTYYYKYSAFNYSGETAASSASTSISPAVENVEVTIPGVGSATNITGFYVYRSADNVTYYRIAKVIVADPTLGAVYIDNLSFTPTNTIAPSGSNTSSGTAEVDGIYYVEDAFVSGSQTINLPSGTSIGLVLISQGDVVFESGSTVNGDNVHNPPGLGSSSLGAKPVFNLNLNRMMQNFNLQGRGSSIDYFAGSSLIILSRTLVQFQGTANLSGGTICAGGNFACIAPLVNRSGATITCDGGSGGFSFNSGGSGGAILFACHHLFGTATTSVAGGAIGGATPSNPGLNAGIALAAGIVQTLNLNEMVFF